MNQIMNELGANIQVNSTVEDINASDVIILQRRSTDSGLCTRCNQVDSVRQALFNTERENIRSYLNSVTEGFMVLSALEHHGQSPIPESMICTTVRLLVNREVAIIIMRERVSIQNPLRHFE